MERFLNLHFMIAVHALIAAAVIVVGVSAHYSAKGDLRELLMSNLERQSALMAELAEITDRNGADLIVERIIADCPRRGEFERLLGQLGRSTHRELLDTQQLFESCGSFFAERKALMVWKLKRELEVLEDNVALLAALDGKETDSYALKEWEALVLLEEQRSDLLNEQLAIQRDIIKFLLGGKGLTSAEIAELVDRSKGVGSALLEADADIDQKRDMLLN